MSQTAATLTRIERLIADAKRQHVGPNLWLLNAQEHETYQKFQRQQSELIQQHDRTNGPGSYFEGVLDGTIEHHDLPDRLKRALEIVDTPAIPITATLSETQEIYEEFLSER